MDQEPKIEREDVIDVLSQRHVQEPQTGKNASINLWQLPPLSIGHYLAASLSRCRILFDLIKLHGPHSSALRNVMLYQVD